MSSDSPVIPKGSSIIGQRRQFQFDIEFPSEWWDLEFPDTTPVEQRVRDAAEWIRSNNGKVEGSFSRPLTVRFATEGSTAELVHQYEFKQNPDLPVVFMNPESDPEDLVRNIELALASGFKQSIIGPESYTDGQPPVLAWKLRAELGDLAEFVTTAAGQKVGEAILDLCGKAWYAGETSQFVEESRRIAAGVRQALTGVGHGDLLESGSAAADVFDKLVGLATAGKDGTSVATSR